MRISCGALQCYAYADEAKLLVLSDGTSFLHWHTPDASFTRVYRKQVVEWVPAADILDKDKAQLRPGEQGRWRPVTLLNELEMIDGFIWANVWHTKRIAVIDPHTAHVVRWVRRTQRKKVEPEWNHTNPNRQ